MERAARTDGKTMNIAIKTLGAISAAFLISGPALAEIYSPAGTWVTGPKDSRYEVTLCGDGDDMCGKLVWLQSPSKELSPYLNKLVLDTAKRIGNQTWRGGVDIAGHKARGTITLVDRNTLDIKACNGATCAQFQLYRE